MIRGTITYMVLLWLVSLFNFVIALNPIAIKGQKLYDNDGKQFYAKGNRQ